MGSRSPVPTREKDEVSKFSSAELSHRHRRMRKCQIRPKINKRDFNKRQEDRHTKEIISFKQISRYPDPINDQPFLSRRRRAIKEGILE